MGCAYHSTHTSFSRRVNVLVRRALTFQELQCLIDEEGHYVFLHCKVYWVECILAMVYIPPPFSMAILRELVAFVLAKPDIPIYIF